MLAPNLSTFAFRCATQNTRRRPRSPHFTYLHTPPIHPSINPTLIPPPTAHPAPRDIPPSAHPKPHPAHPRARQRPHPDTPAPAHGRRQVRGDKARLLLLHPCAVGVGGSGAVEGEFGDGLVGIGVLAELQPGALQAALHVLEAVVCWWDGLSGGALCVYAVWLDECTRAPRTRR